MTGEVRLLLLGAPQLGGDCWHDCIADDARRLGWQVDYRQVKDAPTADLVRAATGADLVVWARTHGHEPAGDAQAMLRDMEDAGAATVGVHFDLYWGLPRREERIGNEAWWGCQYVYTADGGKRDWASRGVRHSWMPPALGTRLLGRGRAAAGGPRYLFVGGNVPGIHGPHRAALLQWAQRRWGHEFRHIGASRRPKMWGRELSDAMAGSRLVIGDSAPAPRYWSDRVVRTLGRGALLAYPTTDGLAEHGFTGEVMLLYDRWDFPEVGRRIASMSEAEHRRMTDAALQLVADRHLWRHRLRRIASEALG